MSRRRRRASERPAQGERRPAQGERAPAQAARGPARGAPGPTHGGPPGRRPPRLSFLAQVGILVAVFGIVSLIADLAGAANLGVALGIGQVCFAIALVVLIVKT